MYRITYCCWGTEINMELELPNPNRFPWRQRKAPGSFSPGLWKVLALVRLVLVLVLASPSLMVFPGGPSLLCSHWPINLPRPASTRSNQQSLEHIGHSVRLTIESD